MRSTFVVLLVLLCGCAGAAVQGPGAGAGAEKMPVKDWSESVSQVQTEAGLAGSLLFRALAANPGDRARLEGDYELTGVGVARDSTGTYYLTQLFINSEPGYGMPRGAGFSTTDPFP